MQDLVAIAAAVVAAAWLARTVWRRWKSPPCGQADGTADTGEFIALDELSRDAHKQRSTKRE